MTGAPDYVDPVEGWRVWRVFLHDGETYLHSVYYDAAWPYGAPLPASCMHRSLGILPARLRRRGHAAPEQGCGCGIHAAFSPSLVLAHLDPLVEGEAWRVLGRVALWGEIVECERGWRGSIGYPTHLYVPRSLPAEPEATPAGATSVAVGLLAYGVPVEFFARGDKPDFLLAA